MTDLQPFRHNSRIRKGDYFPREGTFMYEYKFVRVELSSFRRRPKEDYQAIVNQHAEEGWRLVQIFCPKHWR